MNDFLTNLSVKVDKNLPTILTGASVVTGLATVGYAVWAGFKIKEDLNTIPDADTLEKIKKIAPRLIPILIGASAASGFAIASNHESGKRIAAATGLVAATKLDMVKLQDKTKEILGEEKAKEVEDELKKDPKTSNSFGNYIASKDKWLTFKDANTGYFWDSTLRDMEFTRRNFNKSLIQQSDNDNYTQSIAEFYDRLLGEKYDEVPIHTSVLFGAKFKDEGANRLDFDYEYVVGPDMQPICVVSYSYGEPDGATVWC